MSALMVKCIAMQTPYGTGAQQMFIFIYVRIIYNHTNPNVKAICLECTFL